MKWLEPSHRARHWMTAVANSRWVATQVAAVHVADSHKAHAAAAFITTVLPRTIAGNCQLSV